ncbi:MAG: hypothetical protein ACE5G9_05990 [Nitrospinales bacterium]
MFSQQAKHFLVAFRHLSFLSAGPSSPADPEELGHSTIYFPLVGFLLGLGLMVFYYGLSGVLGHEVVCLLILFLMFLFFNGKQYRACVGFMEHLSGPAPRPAGESAAAFGNDVSRIAVLFFLFMLKFLALLHVGEGWMAGMLVLLPTFSCWSLVYLNHSLAFTAMANNARVPYLRFVKAREFWGATFFTTVAAVLFLELKGLFLLMLVSLWTAVFERLFLLKRGGPIDAALGVVMELNEIFLLLMAIIMRKGFLAAPAEGIFL